MQVPGPPAVALVLSSSVLSRFVLLSIHPLLLAMYPSSVLSYPYTSTYDLYFHLPFHISDSFNLHTLYSPLCRYYHVLILPILLSFLRWSPSCPSTSLGLRFSLFLHKICRMMTYPLSPNRLTCPVLLFVSAFLPIISVLRSIPTLSILHRLFYHLLLFPMPV